MTDKSISINSKNLKTPTKAYKYLFKVFINENTELTYLFRELSPLGKWETFHKLNVFLADKSIKDSYEYDNFLYVLCSTDNRRFNRTLKALSRTKFYDSHYQVGDIRSNLCIIKLKYDNNLRLRTFLDSRYSDIYKDVDGTYPLFNKLFVQKCFYTGKQENPLFRYDSSYYILSHDKEYFDEQICSLIDNMSDELYKELSEKEFDEPLNLSKETIISNKLTSY